MKNALVPSRAQLEAIVAESQGASLLLDADGRILYVSRPLFASSVEEGFRRGPFDGMDPQDAEVARQEFQRCLMSPGIRIRIRTRKRLADGTIHVVEGVMVNKLDDPGVRAIVVHYQDITDFLSIQR